MNAERDDLSHAVQSHNLDIKQQEQETKKMKRTTNVGLVCALVIASVGIAFAHEDADGVDRDNAVRSRHARLATVAIPCIPDGLRFSCSNKSSRRSLEVVDAKCIVGAGDDPEVRPLFDFRTEVAPETTEVAFVFCPDQPVPAFCTARVHPRQNARCALTSPTGGLNAELK
jgi:hypothetical protein